MSIVKVCTWNVCGFRSILKKDSLKVLIESENPDILCLTETRMTPIALSQNSIPYPIYHKYWNHSTAKLGYSGTSIWSKLHPVSVSYGLGIEKHDSEGRALICEYDSFYMICTYVPNAGQELMRLSYRTEEWDVEIRNLIIKLQSIKPVIWAGDLNVVHKDNDIYDIKGKETWACCTPQERGSFDNTMREAELIDTWRYLNKDTFGGWTYYNRRNVKSREMGRGWRIDYILTSKSLEDRLISSYSREDILGSDHYPLITNIRL